MTSLSAIFVDASEATRKNCQIWHVSRAGGSCSVSIPGDDNVFTGTRADCERWVADRAARAGFAAMQDTAQDYPDLYFQRGDEALISLQFLEMLAGGE